MREKAVDELASLDTAVYTEKELAKKLKDLRKEMLEAAENLDFETATLIRDEMRRLEERAGKDAGVRPASTSGQSKKNFRGGWGKKKA
jgi:excinuclease ABC subunit B